MVADADRRKRIAVVMAICAPIVALHFMTGADYRGPVRWFVNGYLIDILLPFYLYFLFGLALEAKSRLRLWPIRAAVVLLLGASVETLQGLGIPVLGRTFDPLDYVAYGIGTGLAATVDRQVFLRLLPFWRVETGGPSTNG